MKHAEAVTEELSDLKTADQSGFTGNGFTNYFGLFLQKGDSYETMTEKELQKATLRQTAVRRTLEVERLRMLKEIHDDKVESDNSDAFMTKASACWIFSRMLKR